MTASVAKKGQTRQKKPTLKDLQAQIELMELERAQRVMLELCMKRGARVRAYVQRWEIAEAVYECFKAGDRWIDFVTADGGWIRLPRADIDNVIYRAN